MFFCSFINSRITIYTFLGLVLIWVTILFTPTTDASTLVIAPTEEEYSVGETFAVNIYIDPQNKTIGSVKGELHYDSETLVPKSILRKGVQFTDWPITPTINKKESTITFSGSSQDGLRTPETVFIVRFQAIAEGTSKLSFANTYIQNSDLENNNLLTENKSAQVKIMPEDSPVNKVYPAPDIYSSDFPNENDWYSSTTGEFVWSTSDAVTATAVTVNAKPNTEPQREVDAVYTPPIDSLVINSNDVSSGEQYLAVRHQYGDEWSDTKIRKIRIDTEPPEPFVVEMVGPDTDLSKPELRFHTNDTTSGIAYYEVQAENDTYSVTPVEAYFGYTLPVAIRAGSSVSVVAYDKAGNAKEADNTLLFLPAADKSNNKESANTPSLLVISVTTTFLALITLVTLLILYLRHEAVSAWRREKTLRKEIKEARRQNKKIFKALRDEIKEQIQTLSSKKRLNKNETAVIEGLNQTIAVSETLLEKEIEDVDQTLGE